MNRITQIILLFLFFNIGVSANDCLKNSIYVISAYHTLNEDSVIKSNGSTFCVENNLFITAAHVFNIFGNIYENIGYITITINDTVKYEEQLNIAYLDVENDIVILYGTPMTKKYSTPLPYNTRALISKEKLRICGFFESETIMIESSFIINSDLYSYDHKIIKKNSILCSGEIYHGMSGGCVLDYNGIIVGIVKGIIQINETFIICTSINYLELDLNELKKYNTYNPYNKL